MTSAEKVQIARHRTAMVRHSLSQPVALMVRHGLLNTATSMFDYGCGQGDDLRSLRGGGIEALGWDPHYAPEAPKALADVVNLGFVLNVVEHREEREKVLEEAWKLTGSILAVSTMIVGQASVEGLRPHLDGYLTSRGTFQKYFQQAELKEFIARTLDVEPIAAAPGIFFVFRRQDDAAEYLLSRRSSWRVATSGYRSRRERPEARPARPELSERIEEEIRTLTGLVLERGRMPQVDEVPAQVLEGLSRERVSLARALEAVVASLGETDIGESQDRRKEDLIVHAALAMLNPSQGRNSERIVRDIKAHFGSQAELAAQARAYLFGLADRDRMSEAIELAAERGLALMDDRRRLIVLPQNLADLPGALRCYAGCVTHLSGEPAEFIYRLDPIRRRANLIVFEQPLKGLPVSLHEVMIDLARQNTTVSAKRRRLLRLADLVGHGRRSKQRDQEKRHREAMGVSERLIFETYEA